jgi:hypothetical protein
MVRTKVKVGYYLSERTLQQLHRLAALDHRTLSGEVEWLVEREWARRAAVVGKRSQGREVR